MHASSELTSLMKKEAEWANLMIAFSGKGEILAGTTYLTDFELLALASSFNDRDEAIGRGFQIKEKSYDITRWHPPVIYGRNGGPEQSEGAAVLKGVSKKGEELYLLATYELPILSALAVPEMFHFFRKHLGEVRDPELNQEIYATLKRPTT